jgi:hypothetical protein
MTTTEEPINQASQQAQQRESVKHLPERLSRRYRNCVLNLSSSYRNPMVKHEPELHIAALPGVVAQLIAQQAASIPSREGKVALTRPYVGGA